MQKKIQKKGRIKIRATVVKRDSGKAKIPESHAKTVSYKTNDKKSQQQIKMAK